MATPDHKKRYCFPKLTSWLACAALVGLGASVGCSKKEDAKGPQCSKGSLEMSAKISTELGVPDVPSRFDCPSRLSTEGAGPPPEAWSEGKEAFWGPELVVQLDKEKTKPLRADGKDTCVYVWSQNCQ